VRLDQNLLSVKKLRLLVDLRWLAIHKRGRARARARFVQRILRTVMRTAQPHGSSSSFAKKKLRDIVSHASPFHPLRCSLFPLGRS